MENKYLICKRLAEDSVNSMESLICNWVQDLCMVTSKDEVKVYAGYIDGENNFTSFLNNLNALGIYFYTRRSRSCKSTVPLFMSDRKDSDINIPFMGSPFKILKTNYMMCCRDGNYTPRGLEPSEQPKKKSRISLTQTKKIGCPAYMIVKSIIVFEDDVYKIKAPCRVRSSNKYKILEKLNKDLLSSTPPVGILRYILLISPESDHIHSTKTYNFNQTLHPQLQREIYKLTEQNICSVNKVKYHLYDEVEAMFKGKNNPKPCSNNKTFYPSEKVILYHVNQARIKSKRNHEINKYNIKGNSLLNIRENVSTVKNNKDKQDKWEDSRKSLINMIKYTYAEHNEENSIKIKETLKNLEYEMKISANSAKIVNNPSEVNPINEDLLSINCETGSEVPHYTTFNIIKPIPEFCDVGPICQGYDESKISANSWKNCEMDEESECGEYYIVEISES